MPGDENAVTHIEEVVGLDGEGSEELGFNTRVKLRGFLPAHVRVARVACGYTANPGRGISEGEARSAGVDRRVVAVTGAGGHKVVSGLSVGGLELEVIDHVLERSPELFVADEVAHCD